MSKMLEKLPRDNFHDFIDVRDCKLWSALEKLAIKRNIDVSILDFGENRKLFGFIWKETDDNGNVHNYIRINERVPNIRKARVLAHELAHYVLHKDVNKAAYLNDSKYHSKIEEEAEKFAKRLMSLVKYKIRRNTRE